MEFPGLRPEFPSPTGYFWSETGYFRTEWIWAHLKEARGHLPPPGSFTSPRAPTPCSSPQAPSITPNLPEALRPRIFLALGQICFPSAWGSFLSAWFSPWTLVMYSIFKSRTKSILLFLAVLECCTLIPLVETLALACTSRFLAAQHDYIDFFLNSEEVPLCPVQTGYFQPHGRNFWPRPDISGPLTRISGPGRNFCP